MNLPPLDILTPQPRSQIAGPLSMADGVQVALTNAGVAVEEVMTHHAPQLFRYMVKVAPGTSPKKIERATDAVSLAVGAPVRYAGVHAGAVVLEQNRDRADVVHLRDVIERSEALIRLGIPLGIGADAEPLTARLADMPHLLVAGTTGSGKSAFLTSMLTALLLRNSPDDMRLTLIDPKRVELSAFAGAPHVAESVTEVAHAGPTLRRLCDVMDARYEAFKALGVKEFSEYNDKADDGARMARHVVVVDELADLMLTTSVCERFLSRLAQLGRAAGIHLVLATQRPEAKTFTGLIRSNIPARVCFAVQKHTESTIALDSTGAEKLRGQGDGLFKAPKVGEPRRFQAPLVPAEDVARVVAWWQRQADRRRIQAAESVPGPLAGGLSAGQDPAASTRERNLRHAGYLSPQPVERPVDNPAVRAEVDAWTEKARHEVDSATASLTPQEILGDAGLSPMVVDALGEALAPVLAEKLAKLLPSVLLSNPVSPTEGDNQ